MKIKKNTDHKSSNLNTMPIVWTSLFPWRTSDFHFGLEHSAKITNILGFYLITKFHGERLQLWSDCCSVTVNSHSNSGNSNSIPMLNAGIDDLRENSSSQQKKNQHIKLRSSGSFCHCSARENLASNSASL